MQKQKEALRRSGTALPRSVLACSGRLVQGQLEPLRAIPPDSIASAYFFHRRLQSSGLTWLVGYTLWPFSVPEMVVISVMLALDSVFHKVRICSRVPDERLYLFPDDVLGRVPSRPF